MIRRMWRSLRPKGKDSFANSLKQLLCPMRGTSRDNFISESAEYSITEILKNINAHGHHGSLDVVAPMNDSNKSWQPSDLNLCYSAARSVEIDPKFAECNLQHNERTYYEQASYLVDLPVCGAGVGSDLHHALRRHACHERDSRLRKRLSIRFHGDLRS